MSGIFWDEFSSEGPELSATVTFTGGDPPVTTKLNQWTGSAFEIVPPTTVKEWNGSAWVQAPLKEWNGSSWEDV